MSGILRLESLTKGNTLKQGDKTPLKYRLFDADGEQLNIAGKSAKVRLVYPDFLTIGYEKDGLTVAQDDTVTFTIDKLIPAKLYHVEIIVDDKFIFPSRADESKFTIDKSSLGTETNIIEIVGVDAVVRKAVDLINADPNLIIDEDKLVGDIISNTGIGSIEEYYRQYSDVIKELSEDKDYHSLPEISGARGGFETLGERLNDTTAQLAQKVNKGNVSVSDINKNLGKLDQSFMSEEFLQQMAGNTPINAVPADGSLTTEKFADNSVGFKKLTDNFMYDEDTNAIGSSHNLDNIIKTGSYLLTGLPVNRPPQTPQNGMVHVFSTSTSYITQIYQDINNRMFFRIKTANYDGFSDWQELLTETDRDSLITAIENNGSRKYPYLQPTDDLNSLISDGRWVAIGSENNPLNRSDITWLVDVKVYKTSESTKAGWGTQFVTPIQHNHNVAFIRRFALSSSGEPTFREWLDLSDKKPLSHLTGKTILNFGDSIFGNTDDETSVSSNISKITGANVLNIGFGGSRVAKHDTYWDAFSWYRLVDEIIKPNSDPTKWVLQDEAISASEGGSPLGMPEYFKSRLQRLKGIDFNNVYGLTLAAGTNDFASNKVDLDDNTDQENTSTYAGSLRYGIRKLQQSYPNIKILLCTPIYRFWIEEGVVVEDSDDKIVRNQKLTDFVEKTLEIGKEFKLPALDNYYQLGINEYNRSNYFPSTDGTHPNQNGRELLGNKIGAELVNCL